jgi:hypothetical protein
MLTPRGYAGLCLGVMGPRAAKERAYRAAALVLYRIPIWLAAPLGGRSVSRRMADAAQRARTRAPEYLVQRGYASVMRRAASWLRSSPFT